MFKQIAVNESDCRLKRHWRALREGDEVEMIDIYPGIIYQANRLAMFYVVNALRILIPICLSLMIPPLS